MQDYREKRDFPRMDIDCPARIEISGEAAGGAIVKNLSGGGMLLWLEVPTQLGATLRIEIVPQNDLTPSMCAEVEVLRCSPIDAAPGSFAVACTISRIVG
jgi:hypothetical protein